jgi:hypothetical protein
MPYCRAADGLRRPLSAAVSGLTWRAEWDAAVRGPPVPRAAPPIGGGLIVGRVSTDKVRGRVAGTWAVAACQDRLTDVEQVAGGLAALGVG